MPPVTRSQSRLEASPFTTLHESNISKHVFSCKLIWFKILEVGNFNPYNLKDLQEVLKLRSLAKGIVSDLDLREMYFMRIWGFPKKSFVLDGWEDMTLDAMREAVRGALPARLGGCLYPKHVTPVDKLKSKRDILDQYRCLLYVPRGVYQNAVGGNVVLHKWGNKKRREGLFSRADLSLEEACRANLDRSVIRYIADRADENDIEYGGYGACYGGHTDLIDFFVDTYDVQVDDALLDKVVEGYGDCWKGTYKSIEHIVFKYGVNPKRSAGGGWTHLHSAAIDDRLGTLRHLVEACGLDVNARLDMGEGHEMDGMTPLEIAVKYESTDCEAYLRQRLAGQPQSE
jgi:hypothetical protein